MELNNPTCLTFSLKLERKMKDLNPINLEVNLILIVPLFVDNSNKLPAKLLYICIPIGEIMLLNWAQLFKRNISHPINKTLFIRKCKFVLWIVLSTLGTTR